jgi:hypothetical protein
MVKIAGALGLGILGVVFSKQIITSSLLIIQPSRRRLSIVSLNNLGCIMRSWITKKKSSKKVDWLLTKTNEFKINCKWLITLTRLEEKIPFWWSLRPSSQVHFPNVRLCNLSRVLVVDLQNRRLQETERTSWHFSEKAEQIERLGVYSRQK